MERTDETRDLIREKIKQEVRDDELREGETGEDLEDDD